MPSLLPSQQRQLTVVLISIAGYCQRNRSTRVATRHCCTPHVLATSPRCGVWLDTGRRWTSKTGSERLSGTTPSDATTATTTSWGRWQHCTGKPSTSTGDERLSSPMDAVRCRSVAIPVLLYDYVVVRTFQTLIDFYFAPKKVQSIVMSMSVSCLSLFSVVM